MLELRVLAGDPSSEEIAAVTVVLLSRAGTAVADEAPPPSRWRLSAVPGAAGRPGPGAWRASALPAAR